MVVSQCCWKNSADRRHGASAGGLGALFHPRLGRIRRRPRLAGGARSRRRCAPLPAVRVRRRALLGGARRRDFLPLRRRRRARARGVFARRRHSRGRRRASRACSGSQRRKGEAICSDRLQKTNRLSRLSLSEGVSHQLHIGRRILAHGPLDGSRLGCEHPTFDVSINQREPVSPGMKGSASAHHPSSPR